MILIIGNKRKKMEKIKEQIQEMINRETRAWNEKDAETLVSIFHPDMVWPWPKNENAHNPLDWIFPFGRYNRKRWKDNWQSFFNAHELIHNNRYCVKSQPANSPLDTIFYCKFKQQHILSYLYT